jgi:hypothetical protein
MTLCVDFQNARSTTSLCHGRLSSHLAASPINDPCHGSSDEDPEPETSGGVLNGAVANGERVMTVWIKYPLSGWADIIRAVRANVDGNVIASEILLPTRRSVVAHQGKPAVPWNGDLERVPMRTGWNAQTRIDRRLNLRRSEGRCRPDRRRCNQRGADDQQDPTDDS